MLNLVRTAAYKQFHWSGPKNSESRLVAWIVGSNTTHQVLNSAVLVNTIHGIKDARVGSPGFELTGRWQRQWRT